VLLPAAYAAMLSVVAERVLARWPEPPRPLVVLGLLAWAPLFPGLVLLAAGWAVLRTTAGARMREAPLTAWVARGLLTLMFLAAVADLAGDYRALA